jgi:hypothetical protein
MIEFSNEIKFGRRKKGIISVGKNGFQQQAMGIYQFISDHLYFNRPDMEIKGERFNSAILLSLLTGLKKGKELIIGEPGWGRRPPQNMSVRSFINFHWG